MIAPAVSSSTGLRYFPHVEGLRGVAALYVLVFHIWQTAIQHPATSTLGSWYTATLVLQYGHFSVAAFIVISGFCLGLPVARRTGKQFDVKQFFVRRAWRLMPAYMPVVVLSAIPFAVTALLTGGHVNVPHIGLAIGMHLALVHNLFYATTEYLNGPLWSIALECQIYVVFALLLVPVWRRFGLAAQLAVALVVGFVPHFALHSLDWTVPWLTALFAMGLIAADLCSRSALPKLPWNALAIAASGIACITLLPFRDGFGTSFDLWLPDLTVGAAVALFFVAAHRNERIVPARLLALRPIVFLGTFSYSLYLVHAPLVDLVGALLFRAHAGTVTSLVVWIGVVVAVIAIAYAFYRVFERPFISSALRRAIDADIQASGDGPARHLAARIAV
ncbi:MAG: acyltransferase [Candidatus Eremiobacteraeota bacterium]|nr:acyltransferase [Candidatus Eremiobacteraeota bacterium]